MATGEEITVDIGQCKKHCTKSKLKKDEFEQLIEENPDIDPRTVCDFYCLVWFASFFVLMQANST